MTSRTLCCTALPRLPSSPGRLGWRLQVLVLRPLQESQTKVCCLSVLPAICPTSEVTGKKDPGQSIAQLSRETGRPSYSPSDLGPIVSHYHPTLLLRMRCHRQVNALSLLLCEPRDHNPSVRDSPRASLLALPSSLGCLTES